MFYDVLSLVLVVAFPLVFGAATLVTIRRSRAWSAEIAEKRKAYESAMQDLAAVRASCNAALVEAGGLLAQTREHAGVSPAPAQAPDGPTMTNAELMSCPDASVWAREFVRSWVRLFPGQPVPDEGHMLAWFAAAMMAMHDTCMREQIKVAEGGTPARPPARLLGVIGAPLGACPRQPSDT